MTQQKSERRTVPQARRKAGVTHGVESRRGGKATSVNEQAWQLGLQFETADNPKAKAGRADGEADTGQPVPAARAAPKSKGREKRATSATMEEVCLRLGLAFEHVASNKGAPGPDRQGIEQVREHLDVLLPKLRASLLSGTYEPGDIRRVWIPKSGGGERGLGIPNVVDRVVQEAVREVLEPLYEPTFHASSHGFRPGRSCHTAIAEAAEYLAEGYEYVVDSISRNSSTGFTISGSWRGLQSVSMTSACSCLSERCSRHAW